MDDVSFSGMYLTDNGKIWCGCVCGQDLRTNESERSIKDVFPFSAGGIYYSDELVGMEKFKATIILGQIIVVDSGGGVVKPVDNNDVRWVFSFSSEVQEVMAGGWLRPPLVKGDKLTNISLERRKTAKDLRRAVAGKEVGYHDNSYFYCVSDELRGRKVLLIHFIGEEDVRVFDIKGNPVPVEVCQPLKYPDGRVFNERDMEDPY